LLHGEKPAVGLDPDEARDQLLAGFQHILVDEYQDIDAPQYELISAIAGRTLDDQDRRLSILAVGDDDQNIYTFRGANVEFIRRFRQDYDAEVHYLVEDYRSTSAIIDVSNRLIAANTDRMKTAHPIRIDHHRARQPAGGEFGQRDALTGGKVQVLEVRDGAEQAPAVLAELQRLRALGVNEWSRIAVLSSTHRELAQVRALAERAGIPVRWMAGRTALPPLHQVREIHRFLARLGERRHALLRAADLSSLAGELFAEESANPWVQLLQRTLAAWRDESEDAELPAQEAMEFLYETCAENRRDFSYGEGVILSTVHAAKGAEYDHVLLIGSWPLVAGRAKQEETRRVFYVGMTRARLSLAVIERGDVKPSVVEGLGGPMVQRTRFVGRTESPAPETLTYHLLGLDDIHLGYPARFRAGHLVHTALAAVRPGDPLACRPLGAEGILLGNSAGVPVAQLSRKGAHAWKGRLDSVVQIRVIAMIHRGVEQETDPDRRSQCLVPEWEVPFVEVVTRQP